MIWGHNLQQMAPFGALTGGFCMVFDSLTLIFLTPDPIFGAPNPRGRPWEARGPFLAQKGGPKKHNCVEGLVPPRGFPAVFKRGMVSMVPRNPLGVPISPQTLPGEGFTRISPKSENPWGPPGPLWGLPIALCGACLLPLGCWGPSTLSTRLCPWLGLAWLGLAWLGFA